MQKNKPIKSPYQPFEATVKHMEEKKKQQVNLLNQIVMYRIGPSQIHGVGVIAMRDIKKGQKMNMDAMFQWLDLPYKEFNKLRPEIRKLLLERWPKIIDGSHFVYPDTKMTAYMNHSEEPNYSAKEDKALRNIKKGEEITEDYRQIANWKKVFSWLKPKPEKTAKNKAR